MFQKIFNITLSIIFVFLVILYAYKQYTNPQLIEAPLIERDSREEIKTIDKDFLKQEIKSFILGNPEVIIESLENLQKKQKESMMGQVDEFLKENRVNIETENNPPILGNPDGDISIVMFFDYNCGFCKKAHFYIKQLIARDKGVKVILRPMPILGQNSLYAASAFLAVSKLNPKDYLLYNDALMGHKHLDPKIIISEAEKLSIDSSVFKTEINSQSIRQLIRKNLDFANYLKVEGAPCYVINGKFVPGLQTTEQIESQIKLIRDKYSD